MGPRAMRKSKIHKDSGHEISDESIGINKKNIVTKPLSLSVDVSAT